MAPAGFTHSEIHGSKGKCPSPWLIAACHVLRRLPVPRHPPCALTIFLSMVRYIHTLRGASAPVRSDAIFLKKKISSLSRYAALKVRRGRALKTGHCAPPGARRRDGSSGNRRGTRPPEKECHCSPEEVILPRKEVIQPHLPVRLPCYDFTPLTLHTFGTSLPRGLGRRLRVQTTRVV